VHIYLRLRGIDRGCVVVSVAPVFALWRGHAFVGFIAGCVAVFFPSPPCLFPARQFFDAASVASVVSVLDAATARACSSSSFFPSLFRGRDSPACCVLTHHAGRGEMEGSRVFFELIATNLPVGVGRLDEGSFLQLMRDAVNGANEGVLHVVLSVADVRFWDDPSRREWPSC
jgi:hypothetical protein